MQSTRRIPLAVGLSRDPALLSFRQWSVTGMTRTAALALMVLAVMVSTAGKVSAGITYTLEDETGSSFGTITTDGHIGSLSATDIGNWTLDISGIVISGQGASGVTGVSATTAAITLDLTSASSKLSLQNDSLNFGDWMAGAVTAGPTYHFEFQGNATGGGQMTAFEFSTNQPESVGTIGVSAVPEPSTAIVAVFGAVAFIAYGWSRHRREQRQAAA